MSHDKAGYDALWLWFGCSRAAWLTLPRVLMHEMPDEWQQKMAELMDEWDETFDSQHMPDPIVQARKGGRLMKWPSWLLCYRHPDKQEIERLKK